VLVDVRNGVGDVGGVSVKVAVGICVVTGMGVAGNG
jgi:hypothetical protein